MKKGFTLIEILIIITIIAVLATLTIYFLNPFEISKRNRDLQRLKDLESLASAINTYLLSSNNPDLDGPFYDETGIDEDNPSIYLSVPKDIIFPLATITDAYNNILKIVQNSSSTNLYNNNGEGWLPINFNEGNVVLPSLPVDPLNIIDNSNPNKNYYYSYVFNRGTNEFEINAKFESSSFKKKSENDNGSDKEIFEVGNNKCLIAFGTSASLLYGTTTLISCSSKKINIGLLPGNITGQDICWNKLFNYYPTRNYVFRNNSGDYLVVSNNFLSTPTTSIYLSLFDKFGNFKLSKAIYFNTTTPLSFNYVHQMNNGDYVLTLSFNSITLQASLLLKLDVNLNPQWSKYYCHPDSNCSAIEESIYVVDDEVGNINLVRNTGYNSGFQIINVSNSSGDILSGSDIKYSIPFGRLYAGNKTNDNGFILLGTMGLAISPPVFLAKFDSQNKFQWIKEYSRLAMSGMYNYPSPRSIFLFQTNDNGYLFNAMYDIDLNATSYNFVKTDYQGNIEWIKKYNGDWSKINIRKIYQDNNDNFWLVINSSSENYLIKLDKNFNKISEYQIRPKSSNDTLVFNNFYQLFDNSYIILGNFIDYQPFLVFIKYAKGGTAEPSGEEKQPPPAVNHYFNLVKFIQDNNLFYLNNNLFTITTTNLFSFSDITSTVTSLSAFSTSTYTITSYFLNASSSLVSVKEKTLVNQCDNYFSKSIAKNKIIENLIKIDNGYLAVGYDLTSNTSSFWIAKISISGEIITSTNYRLDDSYLGHKFDSAIKDGNNFVVIGNYTGDSSDQFYSYVAKFDNQLSLINSSTINFQSKLSDIQFDGNYYVVVGENLGFAEPKALLIKLNTSSLSLFTSSTYREKSNFNSLLIDNNKYYFAAGQVNNQAYLVKINSITLESIWEKEYLTKAGANEEIKKIIFDNDGNIIALSNLFDPEDNKYKIVLRKINPIDGEIIKENLIGNNYFYGRDIILDYYNNFLITGYLPLKQDGNNFSDWTLGLMKVDKNFNLTWIKYYGGQSRKELSFGSSIVPAYDAGYLIGGYNGSNKSAWILKVSYLGDCLGCVKISYFEKIFNILKNNLANFLNLIR